MCKRLCFRYFEVFVQPANWNGASSEFDKASLAKGSQRKQPTDALTRSVKPGKIRLARLTERSKMPPRPPMEMIPIDRFPPPAMRSTIDDISIDRLRRTGQLVERNPAGPLADHRGVNLYSQRSLPARSKPGNYSLRSSGHLPNTTRYTKVRSHMYRARCLRDTPYRQHASGRLHSTFF